MREQLLAKHVVDTESGDCYMLSYYLVIEEILDEDGVPICELYGARIEKQCTERTVSRCISRITTLGSEILRIIEALQSGTVMPETMDECVDVLLG